jgi:methanethiol S-methyltransferase
MASLAHITHERATFALAYAWAGVLIMWGTWASFVIFLASPPQILRWWPLPTIDGRSTVDEPVLAAFIDLTLVAMFGLQHSVMARPWFKRTIMLRIPAGFERTTYVHMANVALFLLMLFWQLIPLRVWNLADAPTRDLIWLLFAAGWVILFVGAWSFGIRDLLGVAQARAWSEGRPHTSQLKTGFIYRWLRHPMYVGVLLGVWATPRMSLGHLLLALSLTAYVLIGMRYEERDLLRTFGNRYAHWRGLR